MSAPFLLPEEYEEFRAAARRLADTGIAPNAAVADERSEYPRASFEAYRDSGLVRSIYPEHLGGDGGDTLTYAILVEEVARVCASSSLFVLISRLGVTPIVKHASAELAQRTVPKVAVGEWQASYCLSEPEAGSDVASMSTRAVRDGDHYVLNGRKVWITNAGISDIYTVFAKTDPAAGSRGISAFVVEKDTPGFSIGKLEEKMGVRGSPTGELLFDDAVVPAENLIGDEGQGFTYAMGALDTSRPIVGAQAVGHRAGRARGCRRVRDRAQAVLGANLRLPGSAVHAGRHGHAHRSGSHARVPGVLDGRCRRARRLEGGGDGEALRIGHGDAGDHGRGPAPRRLRLHPRLSG